MLNKLKWADVIGFYCSCDRLAESRRRKARLYDSDMAKVVSILESIGGILNKVADQLDDLNRRLTALERVNGSKE